MYHSKKLIITLSNTLQLGKLSQCNHLTLHVLYQPPSSCKSKFTEEFNTLAEDAALSPHENNILGDINIHIDSHNLWAQKFTSFWSDLDFVKISCSVKCLKIRKLAKINKSEFISDIADSELIKTPHRTDSLSSCQ